MPKKPVNENYAATVVEIKYLIPIANCDNVQHANIFGNLVVVSKETKIGDIGLFFPIESQLSTEFLSNNSLYRDANLNTDKTKKGYFELNGRIRAVKFRQNPSMGFFIPLSSLDFTGGTENLKIGDTFDELNNIPICRKYIVVRKNTQGTPGVNKNKNKSILVDNQFRLHVDTSQLGKNMHCITPDSLIHISYKLHGTSFISSKVLCKRKLSVWNKIGKKLKFDVIDTEYRNIFSSRRVIKNESDEQINPFSLNTDIWCVANNEIKDFLHDGMTVYGEIIGYLPSGLLIQSGYDYGCNVGEHKIAIYRITYTNHSGHVIEFSAKQVQNWCAENGFMAVPELFYGKAKELIDDAFLTEEGFRFVFLEKLKQLYLEQKCYMCIQDVPAEGIVVRLEDKNAIDVYKYKSLAFYEFETKQLDKGEEDIESENS